MQAPRGNEDAAGGLLHRALAEAIATLGGHGLLTIVELASGGIVIWNVRRDSAGTPRVEQLPKVTWGRLSGEDGSLTQDLLRDVILAGTPSAAMAVRTAPGGLDVSRAMGLLEAILPETTLFDCFGGLGDLIMDVAAGSALAKWYELVVVRRSRSGELTLGGCQLFPTGAQRGDRWPFTVTCEPGDGGRVVFAVVAIEPVRNFQLVSVRSARVAAGSYNLTAELTRPGLVRFEGLPVRLEPEKRGWAELVGSVPAWLPAPEKTHLICAVEVSGPRDIVEKRLDRISRLIRHSAVNGSGLLKVSLIAYGPHVFGRGETDEPPEIMVWAASREAALTAVRRLSDREPAAAGYPAAAQLECVLTDIHRLLDTDDGRPVLVTAGSRPPFPERADASTGILPCPRRNNWREAMHRLQKVERIALGAIRDEVPPVRFRDPQDDDVWTALGATAVTTTDPVDLYDFPEQLGLLSAAAQHVPFPLVDGERG